MSGPEVNVDKYKYMVMSRDQNAALRHNTKNDNSSFEMVVKIRYLEIKLTDQNSIQ